MEEILVQGKPYKVRLFTTEDEKENGLQGVTSLEPNEGALFIYDEPQLLSFWMKDCDLDLDIVFINEELEVVSVEHGEQNSEEVIEADNVMYVLEVNYNSGISIGDEVDLSSIEDEMEDEIEDDEDEEESEDASMLVIGPKGEIQTELKGGERIFSRPHTRTLIKLQKKAKKSKTDTDYKRLGKKIFQYINIQDKQEPEYVELKN